jgi:hypothetical protein
VGQVQLKSSGVSLVSRLLEARHGTPTESRGVAVLRLPPLLTLLLALELSLPPCRAAGHITLVILVPPTHSGEDGPHLAYAVDGVEAGVPCSGGEAADDEAARPGEHDRNTGEEGEFAPRWSAVEHLGDAEGLVVDGARLLGAHRVWGRGKTRRVKRRVEMIRWEDES